MAPAQVDIENMDSKKSLSQQMMQKLHGLVGGSPKLDRKTKAEAKAERRASKVNLAREAEKAREKAASKELLEKLSIAPDSAVKKNPLYKESKEELVELRNKTGHESKRPHVSKRQSAPSLQPPPMKPRSRERGERDSKMQLARSSSQPVLVKFKAEYVNKLKAQPFSLKEKMSTWCRRSPMALYKAHEPPQDHHVPFPNKPYADMICDEYGRNIVSLENERSEQTTKPRDELVLERYPAGKHGILCSFDRIPASESMGEQKERRRRSKPQGTLSTPAPAFDQAVKQREGLHSMPKRAPTNISLIPQKSNVNSDMLQQFISAGRGPSMSSIDTDMFQSDRALGRPSMCTIDSSAMPMMMKGNRGRSSLSLVAQLVEPIAE